MSLSTEGVNSCQRGWVHIIWSNMKSISDQECDKQG